MCRASRRLISSTIAASVVVLPDPVGAAEYGEPARERRDLLDPRRAARRLARRGTRTGSMRTAAAARPRSWCRLMRKRARPWIRNEASAIPACAVLLPRVGQQHRQHRFLDVVAVERSRVQPEDAPIDANRGRGAGDEQQIAAAAVCHQTEPLLESRRGISFGWRRCLLVRALEGENEPFELVSVGHTGGLSQGSGGPTSPGRQGPGIAGSGVRRGVCAGNPARHAGAADRAPAPPG